jgi:transcriptional regulator with XRE-family HTH domain
MSDRSGKDDLRLASPDDPPEGGLLVATNVARLRAQRGWSEATLAARCGIPVDALAAHLDGREVPPLEVLWKIANALRVPVATIVQPLRRGL